MRPSVAVIPVTDGTVAAKRAKRVLAWGARGKAPPRLRRGGENGIALRVRSGANPNNCHRHIDWIGACGAIKIVSAPSPVMGAADDAPTHFHIHTLRAGLDGRLCLLLPERIEIAGVEP